MAPIGLAGASEVVVVPDDDRVEIDFDLLMRACGVEVPADLRQGALEAHRELIHLTALLRKARDPEDEPAQVFRLEALLRGK